MIYAPVIAALLVTVGLLLVRAFRGPSVFDRALAAFAQNYADQNQTDFQAFRAAAADGRIEVAEEALATGKATSEIGWPVSS